MPERRRHPVHGPHRISSGYAVSESFNATLELFDRRHFLTRAQARWDVAAFIGEYNTDRRHSTNGMLVLSTTNTLAQPTTAPSRPSRHTAEGAPHQP